MKIVVIGGSGLIGSKLVARLRDAGHEAVAASPNTGVNTITGEGVAEALVGASVVIDVSNSPSFEEQAVLDFFTTSTRTLLDAARTAGVSHYVALSVVGTQRLDESPYFHAKIAQEKLIADDGIGYTIVHATQFFEFVRSIADAATADGVVRLSHVGIQPMAGDDVAAAVARISVQHPSNGIVEVAGPERWRLDDLVRVGLEYIGDGRVVIPDSQARYFGALLADDALLPGPDAQLSSTRYEEWLPDNPPPAR
ncbi:SDR family oxidoreductase [Protaetiibacter intestinalis]|uniref:SDR family oxidoreductase n=1 Tax=Protaetiibacter intestinalis TaxID=2419774 RepID=A0A387BFB0_9MICO|nr:SDR family oxidoreductase [Protaetiibacter intestinalis]AYF97180.1 SDR family oxidoreductase [Protaetiibacter intestinalis]